MKLGMIAFVILFFNGAFAANKTATQVCEGIHGKNNSALVEYCETEFENFTVNQQYVSVGEVAKVSIQADPIILAQLTKVGAAKIAEAQAKFFLVSEGAIVPEFGLDNAVGGGISCSQAYDYEADDEGGVPLAGFYTCSLNTGVWINYFTNSCNENETRLLQETEEMKINFNFGILGVDASTINTKELVTIRSCAG